MAASENNKQQHLSEVFANICNNIVLPILLQELINDFAVCKHYIGALLLVEDSHDFGNYNYIFQLGATLFNRST